MAEKQTEEAKVFVIKPRGAAAENSKKEMLKDLRSHLRTGVASLQLEETKKEQASEVSPPYSLEGLIRCTEISTANMRCVKAKAQDVASGFSIMQREKTETAEEDDRRMLEEFFATCGGDETFLGVLVRALTDYESTGFGVLEVGRNLNGVPSRIWHMPSHTVRFTQGRKVIQKLKGKRKFFQRFPDKCVVEKGPEGYEPQSWKLVDPDNGKLTDRLEPLKAANEVIVFVNYHPKSPYYGEPDFIPAIPAILGSMYAEDYNLDDFSEALIPPYAVVITGGNVGPEQQRLIEGYFEDIRAGNRPLLVLTVPGKDAKAKFEKIGSDTKEQSWGQYRKDNRDEILLAHGVPPARIGIIEGAHLGGGTGVSQMEHYKTSIVEPRQRNIEHVINERVIRQGFLIKDWQMQFDELDIKDEKIQSEILSKFVESEILTKDEARKEIGYQPKKGEQAPPEEGESEEPEEEAAGEEIHSLESLKASKRDPRKREEQLRTEMKESLYGSWELVERTPGTVPQRVTMARSKIMEVAGGGLLVAAKELGQLEVDQFGLALVDEDVETATAKAKDRFEQVVEDGWLKDFQEGLEEVAPLTEEQKAEAEAALFRKMRSRSGMYAGFVATAGSLVLEKAAQREGREIDWVTTSFDPCPDCRQLALEGPYVPGELENYPGDGSTQCRGNCKCHLDVRKVKR